MTGVRFGPLEIYISCDHTECLAEKRVFSDDLPPGWTKRGKKTFCPDHNRKDQPR